MLALAPFVELTVDAFVVSPKPVLSQIDPGQLTCQDCLGGCAAQ